MFHHHLELAATPPLPSLFFTEAMSPLQEAVLQEVLLSRTLLLLVLVVLVRRPATDLLPLPRPAQEAPGQGRAHGAQGEGPAEVPRLQARQHQGLRR